MGVVVVCADEGREGVPWRPASSGWPHEPCRAGFREPFQRLELAGYGRALDAVESGWVGESRSAVAWSVVPLAASAERAARRELDVRIRRMERLPLAGPVGTRLCGAPPWKRPEQKKLLRDIFAKRFHRRNLLSNQSAATSGLRRAERCSSAFVSASTVTWLSLLVAGWLNLKITRLGGQTWVNGSPVLLLRRLRPQQAKHAMLDYVSCDVQE
jgi:hypothetical protein